MKDLQVKKVYAEIFAFLQDNSNKKVSTILAEVGAMMSKQTSVVQDTTRYDDEGNLTHVFCYYHKEWEDVSTVEYGMKANTKSGLNTMCKQGVSAWTKQQRAKKKAESELLAKLSNGEIAVEDLPTLQAAIAEASKQIVPRAE